MLLFYVAERCRSAFSFSAAIICSKKSGEGLCKNWIRRHNRSRRCLYPSAHLHMPLHSVRRTVPCTVPPGMQHCCYCYCHCSHSRSCNIRSSGAPSGALQQFRIHSLCLCTLQRCRSRDSNHNTYYIISLLIFLCGHAHIHSI